jgi:hypothetical protein
MSKTFTFNVESQEIFSNLFREDLEKIHRLLNVIKIANPQ